MGLEDQPHSTTRSSTPPQERDKPTCGASETISYPVGWQKSAEEALSHPDREERRPLDDFRVLDLGYFVAGRDQSQIRVKIQ